MDILPSIEGALAFLCLVAILCGSVCVHLFSHAAPRTRPGAPWRFKQRPRPRVHHAASGVPCTLPISRDPICVLIVVGHGGGGHSATAQALVSALEICAPTVRVVLTDASAAVERNASNPFWQCTGCTGDDVYNWGLRRGGLCAWAVAVGLAAGQRAALAADWCLGDRAAHIMGRIFAHERPDVVCNLTPGTSAFLSRGLAYAGLAQVALVAVVTDYEATGTHDWLTCADQYTICGTAAAFAQARARSARPDRVLRVSGLPVRPCFYRAGPDPAAAVASLGLNALRRTCVFCWGAVGAARVLALGRAAARAQTPLNLVFLCGRNAALAAALRAEAWPCPVHIQGFTDDVCAFMRLADVLVCKPGPGVCTEAALLGVPMLLDVACKTMPQEVPVYDWVVRQGLGVGFGSEAAFREHLDAACDSMSGRGLAAPVARVTAAGDMDPGKNVAVFEIVGILARLVSRRP